MEIDDFINRPYYLEKTRPYILKDIIKVFVGQRRVGKSYILLQTIQYIKENYQGSEFIYINKELKEFAFIKTDDDLYSYVKEQPLSAPHKTFLFIDEIQEIANFENALRSLLSEKKYDIYCSGSNANMLSGELATYLSGRYIEINVFSLNFNEFLTFHNLSNNNESLNKYLRFGGLPYLIHLPLEELIVYDYLKNIYNTILFKDVVKRFNVRNIPFLENLVLYIADILGSIVSSKKISEYLKSQRINISPQVVLNYINYLQQAFFIFKVNRADVTGRKIFEVGEKYYFEDLGLRNALSGFNQGDINKVIENVIYMHLICLGYNVKIGVIGNKEIDFICERFGEKIYIQACYLLADEKVIKREYDNLLQVKDNFPKYVVSMDELLTQNTYHGIKHLNLRQFLTYFE